MQVQAIELQNFLSYGARQTLELGGKGLVLIEGINRDDPQASSNGSGKSGLLEGLVWGITGKTLRPIKADDVINKVAGKDCEVEVRGSVNGSSFVIRRFRKLNRKSGVTFRLDGQDVTQHGDPKATQAVIESTLGVDHDLLTNTVVFGQGAKWRFSELTDAPQKALLDKVLGLEIIPRAHDIAKARYGEVKDRVSEQLRVANDLSGKVDHTKILIRELLKEHKANRARRLKELEASITKHTELIESKEGSDDAERMLIEGKISTLEARFGVESETQKNLAITIDEESDALLEARSVMRNLHDSKQRVRGEMDEIKAVKGNKGKCSRCGSRLDKKQIKQHLSKLQTELEAIVSSESSAEYEIHRIKGNITAARTNQASLLESLDDKREELADLRHALKSLDARSTELKNLKSSLKAAKSEYARVKADRKPASTEKHTRKLSDLVTGLSEAEEKLSVLRSEADHLEFWVNGFGNAGIKSFMLDYAVPLLNKRAREFSKHLMQGLVVEFDSESSTAKGDVRDKFEVSVTNSHGANVYHGNSGGERRKIDIVVARTLQSLGEDKGQCNVAFWDEVFESLDATSCESVMAMLREETEKKETVFVVSHLEWLKPHFPKVVTVVKEGGFSRIES